MSAERILAVEDEHVGTSVSKSPSRNSDIPAGRSGCDSSSFWFESRLNQPGQWFVRVSHARPGALPGIWFCGGRNVRRILPERGKWLAKHVECAGDIRQSYLTAANQESLFAHEQSGSPYDLRSGQEPATLVNLNLVLRRILLPPIFNRRFPTITSPGNPLPSRMLRSTMSRRCKRLPIARVSSACTLGPPEIFARMDR
jgi:hypothetical protein